MPGQANARYLIMAFWLVVARPIKPRLMRIARKVHLELLAMQFRIFWLRLMVKYQIRNWCWRPAGHWRSKGIVSSRGSIALTSMLMLLSSVDISIYIYIYSILLDFTCVYVLSVTVIEWAAGSLLSLGSRICLDGINLFWNWLLWFCLFWFRLQLCSYVC